MQLGQSNKKCSQNFGVKITLNSAVWNREKSKTNIKLCPKSENVGANTEECGSVMCPTMELTLGMSKNVAHCQNMCSLVRHTKSA